MVMAYKTVLEECKRAPAADVVEVCRCKDCAYAGKGLMQDDMYACSFYRDMRKEDDFCNYGKRRGA
jgi:hypothetical protein